MLEANSQTAHSQKNETDVENHAFQILEAQRENYASQKLEPICAKYYYIWVCKFEEKSALKRRLFSFLN